MSEEPMVIIAGCGPSAMCIAHACHQMGVHFGIYSPKTKSHISGAQYLHTDIGVRAEGITPDTVHYVHLGTEPGYRRKVYGGDLPDDMETSWNKFHGDVEAWPLPAVYDWLWGEYHGAIIDQEVTAENLVRWAEFNPNYLVFSTAPLNKLLPEEEFVYEDVFIVDGAAMVSTPQTIVYNGNPGTPWYRSSNLWGHMSIEWPVSEYYRRKMPMIEQNPKRIRKPLKTAATLPGVILSGRYGRWEKGVLVDESYHQAIAEIQKARR